jgi:hypothetical protein
MFPNLDRDTLGHEGYRATEANANELLIKTLPNCNCQTTFTCATTTTTTTLIPDCESTT